MGELRLKMDAFAGEGFWAGDAGIARQGEAQRQLRGVANADTSRDQYLTHAHSIIAHLQRRIGIEEVETVMRGPSDPERLAEPAGSAGQLARVAPSFSRFLREGWETTASRTTRLRAGNQPPISRHLLQPGNRLQRPQQYAPSVARLFAREVHAVVEAINDVNVRVARRPEENRVSWSGTAMRVRCGIGDFMVRAKIGFDFNDPAGQELPLPDPSDKEFAEQERSHKLRGSLEECALQQAPGDLHAIDFNQFCLVLFERLRRTLAG